MKLLETIGEPATLEQLAEECTELAHACLKLARVERGENPTPKLKHECTYAVIEEVADVEICIGAIIQCEWWRSSVFSELTNYKLSRIDERLSDGKYSISGK